MLNVSFYIFTMSMLNVSLDKCEVAMEIGLGVVVCFEVLSRMTLHLWTGAELWMSAEGFLGDYVMRGVLFWCVRARNSARGCSLLLCVAAQNVAGTGGSRVRRR